MQKIILTGALLLLPVCALGAEPLPSVYVEASAGLGISPIIDTRTASFVAPPDRSIGKAQLNYGDSFMAGAEAGMALSGADGNWRFGVNYEHTRLNLGSIDIRGLVDGVPGAVTYTGKDLAFQRYPFNYSVHLALANLYYDFPAVMGRIHPYAGLGAGTGFVEDSSTEFALSGTAGIRIAIGRSAYAGLRYRYYWVSGSTNRIGVRMLPLTAHTISTVIGYRFE